MKSILFQKNFLKTEKKKWLQIKQVLECYFEFVSAYMLSFQYVLAEISWSKVPDKDYHADFIWNIICNRKLACFLL